MEVGAACRPLGLSHFVSGDFRSARTRLEQAMHLHEPAHDDESRRLFGFDPQAGAMAYLACVNLRPVARSYRPLRVSTSSCASSGF
jgi:hypothetical protein